MSVPFGTPQQAPQQPSPPGQPTSGPNLKFFLTLVAAGVGLVGYVLGFVDGQAAVVVSNLAGFCLIAASALAGLRVLPKAPNTLYAAIPLAVYAALALLQGIVSGSANLVATVLLVLAILQLGAVVGVLLMDAEIIVPPAPKSSPAPMGMPSGQFPQPGQGPPAQPGQFGQQPQPWGPPGPQGPQGPPPGGQPQPGQFGQQPQPGGWKPHSGGQPQPGPGQPGQPGGWNPQSGGFPVPGQPGQQPSQQPGQQPNQGGQSGGGQGTQHMQPPGSQSRDF